MANHHKFLRQMANNIYLSYMGMETDLIFNRGMDLPGFASYPLLETKEGAELLAGYIQTHINLARDMNMGAILDSSTWTANRDRGSEIGQSPQSLKKLNIKAIELLARLRDENLDVSTMICAQVGPRGDGYAPSDLMTAQEAENYHAEQIRTLSQTESTTTLLVYQAVFIGLLAAVPLIWLWKTPDLAGTLLMLSVGVISAVASWIGIQSLRLGEASVVANIQYMQLIYGAILGYFLFSEIPDAYTLVGAAIIIGSSIYIYRREALKKRELRDATD